VRCDPSSTDLACLAVGQLAGAVKSTWHYLLKQAMLGNPKSVATRYTNNKHSNAIARAIFKSFAAEQMEPDADTVRLVKRVRLFDFDFTENESHDEARALELCQGVLVSGQGDEAIHLWNRLSGISAERRAHGGILDYPGLITSLGTEFALKDRIDHSRDWATLDRRSAEVMKSVRDTVGDRVCLVRRELMDELRSHAWQGGQILITGDGGCGKSSVVKRLAQSTDLFERCLWLNAFALDFDSIAEIERFLGITNSLEALLTAGSGSRACLVLDGFEVFSQRSLARVRSLLELLRPNPSLRGWTVLMTTRLQAVVGAQQVIVRAGIESDQTRTVYVKPPSDDECSQVLQTCRSFNGSLIRRELRSALANLKILDWLTSDSNGFEASEVQSWVGTTGVINALWGRWVGNDSASAVRSGVMKKLGRLEGEGLLQGVGTSELDEAQLSALKELESLDLLTVSDERVRFRHDTLGDWARLRVLIENPPRGEALAAYARFPRWLDAIRLYGQRLLEGDDAAPARWMDVLTSLEGGGPNVMLVRDMFVEGLFCTPHALELLERAWSALVENEGILLQRMLSRFQHVATIPDPRVGEMSATAEEIAALAVHMRFPWFPLWPGVLSALAAHAEEVARLCPIEAAQVCAIWLRCMPIGAIGRIEAGTVALAIGREIQAARGEGRNYYDDSDTVVFEAVLEASPEHPDQIVSLCLELARRRPDPPDVVARAASHKKRVEQIIAERLAKNPPSTDDHFGTSMLFDSGILRPQFPDGPADRVDDALQRAVIETQGLISLASVRPDEAKEILLACSLEPPRYVQQNEMMSILDHFGIENIRGVYAPMYFRGPWLQLLRLNPGLGAECIMRLVDHATEQWELHELPQNSTDEQRAMATVSLTIGGDKRTWHGNMRTYGWHRERFCSAHLLSSALMALERYLYECVDQEQPVDAVVSQILTTGRSVATLAVLASVAKYKPELLAGCLKPLLAAWQLYGWDIQLVQDGNSLGVGAFLWVQSGEQTFNIVREWNAMPHRKSHLRDHAVGLLLTSPEIRDAYETIRGEWQTELKSGLCSDPESLELLISRFDPDYYKVMIREDGTHEVQFEWPDAIKARTEESVRKAQDGMRLIAFPLRCRELINKGELLDDELAHRTWDDIQAFHLYPDGYGNDGLSFDRRLDAVLGGIAVLYSLAHDWLSKDSDRVDWCSTQIINCITNPPPLGIFETDNTVSTDRWHSFLADISISMLLEDGCSRDVRAFVSHCVLSRWYATTGIALTAACRLRSKLGTEFDQLINLAVLWSALRTTLPRHDPTEGEIKRFHSRLSRLQHAYIYGRIPSKMLDWDAIAGIASRTNDRAHLARFPKYDGQLTPKRRSDVHGSFYRPMQNHHTWHPPHGFDIEALRHSFDWLPNPDSIEEPEVSHAVNWLKRLLNVTLGMIPHGLNQEEVHGTPYAYDGWVFDRVATFVAQLESDESARELWSPILELGPSAHYWVESFLGDWTVSALSKATSSARYFDRWRQMIDHALESPVWMPEKSGSFHQSGLWEHLLGMQLGAQIVAADGNQAEFARMKNEYAVWADTFLLDSHSLRAFLNLLRQPGARPLLCPAVVKLLRVAKMISPYDWARDPLADDLARVMSLAWKWSSDTITADHNLMADFMELLNIIVSRQSRVAMTLRETVAQSSITPE
jgi:hypothetical protein